MGRRRRVHRGRGILSGISKYLPGIGLAAGGSALVYQLAKHGYLTPQHQRGAEVLGNSATKAYNFAKPKAIGAWNTARPHVINTGHRIHRGFKRGFARIKKHYAKKQ